MRVFISYTNRDPDKRSRDFGRQLADLLIQHELNVDFDQFSFRHSQSVVNQMIEGISQSDRFVMIATPHAFDSNFVQAELRLARDRAARVAPEPFMHVVVLSRKPDLDFLPPDLRAYLCHTARGKSERRLLYEVLFSLLGFELGELAMRQRKFSSQSKWLILERLLVLDIQNYRGDTKVTTQYAALNISPGRLRKSNRCGGWPEGTRGTELHWSGKLHSGESIEPITTIEDHRGRRTSQTAFVLPRQVAPDEVVEFTTEYNWPGAFDLHGEDVYKLESNDFAYGSLGFEIRLPRQSSFVVTIEAGVPGDAPPVSSPLKEVAKNRFRYYDSAPAVGGRYVIRIRPGSADS